MPPRAKLKVPAAAAPASGAALEHLPEILRALLSAENESRGVAEATLKALVRDARGRCIAALLRHARGDADARGDGKVTETGEVVRRIRLERELGDI